LEKKVGVGEEKSQKKEPVKEHEEKKLTEKIYGFTIIQKKTTSGGKVYFKWYAHQRINAKQVWVYLGSEASDAGSKVKAWLEKNCPELLQDTTQGNRLF